MLKKLALSALASLLVGSIGAQDPNAPVSGSAKQVAPAGKRALTPEDYKAWERFRNTEISNDGRFFAWGLGRIDGEVSLHARKVDGPEKWVVPNATQPAFSDSSKWLGYVIGVSKADSDRNAEQGKPSPSKLGIRNMETGEEQVFDDVLRFEFLKGTDTIVAIRPKNAPGPGGNDLLLINPAGGEPTLVSNVSFYVANESETLLALKIRTGTGYNALQIFDPKTFASKTLYSGKEDVGTFDWAKKSDTLVVAVAMPNEKKTGNNYRLWRFAGFQQGDISKLELSPEKSEGFPAGMRITESTPITLSDDGESVLFGVQPWLDRTKPANPKDLPTVLIWHTKDTRPIPQQQVQSFADRGRSALYLWKPANKKILKVSESKDNEVPGFEVTTRVSPDHRIAVFADNKPYSNAVTNGIEYEDIYVVNLTTGEKSSVAKRNQFPYFPSPTGKFIAYFENKYWWSYDTETKKSSILRSEGKFTFDDSLDDRTVDEKRPAGYPVWLDSDAGMIVSDEYDAWFANPKSGKMVKLTDGRADKLKFEFLNTTPYADYPEAGGSYYFTMMDTVEKKMGFFISDGKGGGKAGFYDDALLSRLTKAKNADRMMFVMESFQKSPDVYITNEAMTAAKPITKTNPQQKDFFWGKSELVKFKSRWGLDLQGVLVYPANFDPTKKYPMVTYIYERLSDEKNAYEYPVEWNAYGVQHLSQNGYFVFKPDMAYKPNGPGESAVDCLEPAVDAALKLQPSINPKKVGLIGHSWGAYQTAFATTVSNRFAVGACGAPLTELTSMYNSFYWNAGISSQGLFESSQGRIKYPFWENPKAFLDNSPVWKSDKRKVPLLMAVGDKDGAVDWTQGQYLYSTLRRMGKQCVLLVYAGENHNFRVRANQLDYAIKLRHWLDVYLKDAKPETWVTEGVPYVKQTEK